jgi:hypothetical protein
MAAVASVPVAEAPPDVRKLVGEGVERVFIGNLLPFMVALGYTSKAQYDDVKRALVAMGCVRQLQRGARFKRGAWALLRPPDEGLWRQYVGPFRSRSWPTSARPIMRPWSGSSCAPAPCTGTC